MSSAAALAQVIASIETNAFEIRKALRSTAYVHDDCIYVWPEYWIGVSFKDNHCRGCGVDHATIVKANANLVFTNGHGQRAILMNRDKALRAALAHTLDLLATFKAKAA